MSQLIETRRRPVAPTRLSTAAVGLLALAAAIATATSYVLQPELPTVARDAGSSLSVIGVIAGVPIVGYLVGLALLVPLADRVRSDRLIATQMTVLAAGLLIAAVARGAVVLGAGMFVSGMCASTGAQMSSLAGRYSDEGRRGRAVGTVTAGISAGIVLGRILGGTLADLLGWRQMLGTFAGICVVLAVLAWRTLPGGALRPAQSYVVVVRSMPGLVRSTGALRSAALSGALWFLSFSLVWVGLSVTLARPPLQLSSARIGVYSLAGLLGVLATRVAGALADRYGSRAVVLGGLTLAAACCLTMTLSLHVIPVLLIALGLFDAGLFSAQVANQTAVLAIDPDRPAQFNSAYMVVYFIGGSSGTVAGGSLVDLAGWTAVSTAAACAILAAMCIVVLRRARTR